MPLLWIISRLVRNVKHQQLLFVVAGTSASSDVIRHLSGVTREIGIHENVVMRVGATDEEKNDLLSASDIFVSPSDTLQESCGLTPVEAMSCGLPQVVPDWDGYRDTVVDGVTGFLVPTCWGDCSAEYYGTGELLGWEYDHLSIGQSVAFDGEIMYQRLRELVMNSELRIALGANSRRRAVEEFGYSPVGAKYRSLFLELSAISKSIVRPRTPRRFDLPVYFQAFGHYATAHLSDADTVMVSRYGPKDLKSIPKPWLGELRGNRLLDSDLLESIIAYVKQRPGGVTVEEIGECAMSCSRSTCPQSLVRRMCSGC